MTQPGARRHASSTRRRARQAFRPVSATSSDGCRRMWNRDQRRPSTPTCCAACASRTGASSAQTSGASAPCSTSTAGDAFVFGHDGQNDPAINAAVRVNPDNSDAIVVLTSGGRLLATRLASEWTYWQTGGPDFLVIGTAIREAVAPSRRLAGGDGLSNRLRSSAEAGATSSWIDVPVTGRRRLLRPWATMPSAGSDSSISSLPLLPEAHAAQPSRAVPRG